MAIAADDDQHLAVAEARPGRRELHGAGQQVGLAAHVGDGVLGELGERLVDPLALLVELALELDRAEHAAAQDRLAADADRAARDASAARPSRSSSKGSLSSTSISSTPARASISGPAFG